MLSERVGTPPLVALVLVCGFESAAEDRVRGRIGGNSVVLKFFIALEMDHKRMDTSNTIRTAPQQKIDRGGHDSVFVLLHLSSAFDTVNHAILLEVLSKRFGVAGIALVSLILGRTDAGILCRSTAISNICYSL